MKSCNLTFHDYTRKDIWVGTGNTNCTDPKTLRKQIGTRLIDLGIEAFRIRTFDQAWHYLYPNDSSLTWTPRYMYPIKDCLTLSISENLKKLGIQILHIITHDPPIPNLMVNVHQKGLQFTDTPNAWRQIEISEKGQLEVSVGHDVVELLEYDGEKCENYKDYKLSECQFERMEQASDISNKIKMYQTTDCPTFDNCLMTA